MSFFETQCMCDDDVSVLELDHTDAAVSQSVSSFTCYSGVYTSVVHCSRWFRDAILLYLHQSLAVVCRQKFGDK